MEDTVYLDEDGSKVDQSAIGKTHEIADTASSGTNKTGAAPIYNRLMQEERVSNFISQTSPTQSLTAINYMLRGYAYDEQNKEWAKVADGVPDQIRMDFLQFITPDLSEDVRMTNLSPQQINGIMECVIEWVVDYLDIVADKYNLQEEQMTKIALIIIKAVFYTLLRATNGIERSQMFKSLSMGENLSPVQQAPKKSLFNFWSR